MIASALLLSMSLVLPLGGGLSASKPVESVEWLCHAADLVVVGRITKTTDLGGSGKSTGLMSFEVQGSTLGQPTVKGTYGIAIRDVSLGQLNAIREANTELVIFLRRTAQSFYHEGRSMDTWPLRMSGGGHWVIPVADVPNLLFSAKDGAVLSDIDGLRTVCERAQRPPGTPKYPRPQRGFVPFPEASLIAKSLGERAPKHLIVPMALFPNASTKAPRVPPASQPVTP